jgi:putative toxin-antitoxin system antitoxin component (TIGR02293 family)
MSDVLRAAVIADLQPLLLECFGDDETARGWLHAPAIALHGARPIDLLVTEEGLDQVRTLLGRIATCTYT